MDRITARTPHDQTVLGTIDCDDAASVDDKVARARAAMREWARFGPMERAERLHGIAETARSALDDLAHGLSLEQGKTLKEARLEIERFIGPFLQYAGMATEPRGSYLDLGAGVHGHVERVPVGVVAGIVPWNFPASLVGSKAAPALAAGCAFLIKPAETTALITGQLIELLGRHLPDGLVDVVIGGAEVGRQLIEHSQVARVAFTGSTAVGRVIAQATAPRLKRLSLELGGCDPFILCEDADMRPAIRSLMGTRFFNAGQVCVAPKRLIVRDEVADEAIEMLTERLGRVRLGPGLDEGATMGPLHTEAARDLLEEQVEDAAEHGGKIVGGGRPDGDETAGGWFAQPALLLDPPPEARVRHEETFGPVLTVVRVRDDEEAVRIANETPYGLGASVWSGDQARAFGLARRIDAGYKWVNTLGRVYDELPFGGVKDSGFGREHGREALDSYLEPISYVHGG